jgi:hypothetical protein
VYRIDPASGAATLLTSSLDATGRAAFVPSRDGRTLFGRVIHDEFLRLPNLSLSHDGRKLAVRSGPLLGVVDLASGAYTRLYTRVFETDRNVMFGLAWSADDSRVVVIARDPGTAICELWIYPAAGGPRVSQRLPVEMRGLSIGPDGTAAAIRVEQRRQIWALENFLPATK